MISSLIIATMLSVMPVDLGTFEITAYAEDEITATGTIPREYVTVAVDPDVIPYGS